ncbi:hypothetical protein OAG06_02505 [Verrucomicrobia bacterium]|nr:hypothetical protein [Verrucomicrobiota bacterium]MDB4651874.1 hypothetical protein [Verrucomicrobiota bacterium]
MPNGFGFSWAELTSSVLMQWFHWFLSANDHGALFGNRGYNYLHSSQNLFFSNKTGVIPARILPGSSEV